ncbi:MAG: hypothetical protein A2Y40_00640 [Candidatus Margulisbacteria bacterium GWF2_35_9]|nr:MAG: hypothetical protein A2Y40_00640 [Candidatus Margulisbacteria bacterium GWF2_35_9]
MVITRLIKVNDTMQQDYEYICSEPIGKKIHKDFKPDLSPKKMLQLGVFGGKYMGDCAQEFPHDWFINVVFCHEFHDPELNYFKVNASLSLREWQNRGWIYYEDPRGWFQWYCRYYMGRRIPFEDDRQIKRWKAIFRHVGAIKKNCIPGDLNCRKKQRQALLHWAIDSRKF